VERTDLAYTAGIIDGEGCISIGTTSQVSVQVGNTNEWLLQWLKFTFGGRVIPMNDKRTEKRGWKPMYHWYLRQDEAREFLKLVYPHLRIKRVQAEIAMKMLELRGKKGRRFNETERTVAEAQRILIRGLNKTKVN